MLPFTIKVDLTLVENCCVKMWNFKLIFISLFLAFISVNCEIGYNFINQLIGNRQNAGASSPCKEDEKSSGQSRIVGGETSPVNYPYQVSLQMESRGGAGFFFFLQQKSNYSHFCGGSVLNENYIATAAHCIQGFNISKMSVFAGENDLREESKGSRHFINNCTIHPDYVELNNSDVAVCRLSTPFPLGEKIAPIQLDTEYVGGKVNCTLTGWGYTSMIRGFPLPHKLQRANLPTITNEECNAKGHNVGPKEVCTFSRSFLNFII